MRQRCWATKKTPLLKKIVSEKLGGAQRSEVEEREREGESERWRE